MHAGAHPDPLGRATEEFLCLRPRLFGIAYRILGSAAEAEDVVQETWVRWQKADRDAVHEPGAFLTTVTARLAINLAQSARVRRGTYVGPWLPEPVDTAPDPQLGAERAAAVEMAVLLVLEKLNPVERGDAAPCFLGGTARCPPVLSVCRLDRGAAPDVTHRPAAHPAVPRVGGVARGPHDQTRVAGVAAGQLDVPVGGGDELGVQVDPRALRLDRSEPPVVTGSRGGGTGA
ncbi:sigma factor [Streptomyces sp. NPDC046979]|uniref:sigma factor n=1 Tax=Streptomyces sp. NPDC046979 TaxID=3154604 RepID=UPI0033CF0BF5